MKKLLCLLSSLLLLVDVARSDDKRARADEALRRSLMDEYDLYALPNKLTNVNITGMDVRSFQLDESDSSVIMELWFKYTWNDPRLVWKPEDHMNIQYLAMGADKIWKPDLATYNAHGSKDITMTSDVLALAYPNGKMLHVPWYTYRFKCALDLTYWPHDAHNCTLIFGSWVHSGMVVDLILDNFKVVLPEENENIITNMNYSQFSITDWSVFRLDKYYDCCKEPYVSIWTSFIIKRYAPAYTWTVKLPLVCLCLLTLVMFMLHPTAGEKVSFGGLVLILNFLFMFYITNKIGDFAFNTPIIVQLLGVQIVLVMVCLFLSAFVTRMAKGPHIYGLPSTLRKPIANLAGALFLGNYVDPKLEKSEDMEAGSKKASPYATSENSNLCEWVMLAAVVDRLALLVYFAICIISLVRANGVI